MPTRLLSAGAAIGLLAGAAHAQTPVLTVYTYSSFTSEYGPGAAVEAAFEAECGCDLRWVATDDAAALLARLTLEGAATRADVVLGFDANQVAEARASGLFAPHGADTRALDLPIAWDDAVFLPFDWGWLAFVYDTRVLAAPPASLAELVNDPDGPTVIVEDPRTSSPGLGLLMWMKAVYGDAAEDAWRRLAPRIVTVTQGWSDAYGLFLEGEADMVLSYTTSPAYHLIAEGDPNYAAAAFAEGNYLQVELAATVASTDVPELAASFMRFILSPAFQGAIPEGNWMYPAAHAGEITPEGFAGLAMPQTTLLLDPEAVAANRRAWIDEWLAALR